MTVTMINITRIMLAGIAIFNILIPSSGASTSRAEVEAVRSALNAKRTGQGDVPSDIVDLSGYNFHWEIDLGTGLHAIVVSCNLRGIILIFNNSSSIVSKKHTGEIVSASLFDFDGDGIGELITEQIEGRGTGVLVKKYYIYRVSAGEFRELWQGLAYSHMMLKESTKSGLPLFEVIRGFIRYEPGGGGVPGPRLLHLTETATNGQSITLERRAYVFKEGTFREIPWPW